MRRRQRDVWSNTDAASTTSGVASTVTSRLPLGAVGGAAGSDLQWSAQPGQRNKNAKAFAGSRSFEFPGLLSPAFASKLGIGLL